MYDGDSTAAPLLLRAFGESPAAGVAPSGLGRLLQLVSGGMGIRGSGFPA